GGHKDPILFFVGIPSQQFCLYQVKSTARRNHQNARRVYDTVTCLALRVYLEEAECEILETKLVVLKMGLEVRLSEKCFLPSTPKQHNRSFQPGMYHALVRSGTKPLKARARAA